MRLCIGELVGQAISVRVAPEYTKAGLGMRLFLGRRDWRYCALSVTAPQIWISWSCLEQGPIRQQPGEQGVNICLLEHAKNTPRTRQAEI